MTHRLFKTALILGLLSAIGPFAIDMYLPALPSIGDKLDASIPEVQASLMIFMAAVAVCQIFYGPVSDMVGRKPPLYFGLSVFIVGATCAALAPSIGWLIAARFLQGVGACASMAIPRAVVRDYHTGPDAARLMTLLMLVFSVSPILAPLSGSLIVQFASWRGIFGVTAVAALLAMGLLHFALPETRPKEKRLESSFGKAIASYRMLLGDRRFLGLSFIGGFGISSFFGFLANSSFVYIDHYGLTPTQYSFAFSANAIGFIGMSQFTANFARRFGFDTVMRYASGGYFALMATVLVLFLGGVDSLSVLAPFLFCGFACLGLIIPSSAVLALDDHGEIAGSASAMMGTIQMVTGASVMAVVSAFFDGTAVPMVAGIAACATVVLVLTQATLRRPRAVLAE